EPGSGAGAPRSVTASTGPVPSPPSTKEGPSDTAAASGSAPSLFAAGRGPQPPIWIARTAHANAKPHPRTIATIIADRPLVEPKSVPNDGTNARLFRWSSACSQLFEDEF